MAAVWPNTVHMNLDIDLKTPRKKTPLQTHTLVNVNNQNKPTTSNGLIKMTNLDRIVIYVETSIRVLLHRDLTFGPCAIRVLGRDRCGGVKTRSLVSKWTASDQMWSVLMTSVNKRIEKRNPFLPTLLHYTLFNDSKTSFQYFFYIPLTLTQSQEETEPSPCSQGTRESVVYLSYQKIPAAFNSQLLPLGFKDTEKNSCATGWGCKHCGSRYTCLQTNIMSWRECLSVKRGFPHNGFFGATRQWLICTSKVMQQN